MDERFLRQPDVSKIIQELRGGYDGIFWAGLAILGMLYVT